MALLSKRNSFFSYEDDCSNCENSVDEEVIASDSNIAQQENEINNDLASVEEHLDTVTELVQQKDNNQELLDNTPEAITPEVVTESNKLLIYHLGKLGYGYNKVKDIKIGTESIRMPIQNMQITQEGLGATIREFFKKIWEWIKGVFKKVVNFFKELFGITEKKEKKLVEITITPRSESISSKSYEQAQKEMAKETAKVLKDVDEVLDKHKAQKAIDELNKTIQDNKSAKSEPGILAKNNPGLAINPEKYMAYLETIQKNKLYVTVLAKVYHSPSKIDLIDMENFACLLGDISRKILNFNLIANNDFDVKKIVSRSTKCKFHDVLRNVAGVVLLDDLIYNIDKDKIYYLSQMHIGAMHNGELDQNALFKRNDKSIDICDKYKTDFEDFIKEDLGKVCVELAKQKKFSYLINTLKDRYSLTLKNIESSIAEAEKDFNSYVKKRDENLQADENLKATSLAKLRAAQQLCQHGIMAQNYIIKTLNALLDISIAQQQVI